MSDRTHTDDPRMVRAHSTHAVRWQRRPTVANMGRFALGGAYLAGAVFNLVFTRNHPELYLQWVANPVIPFYKDFFIHVVTPNAALLTTLAALYEIAIGALILSKGVGVKVGLVGGIVFNLLLAPMWIGQLVPNLILAALHIPLLRRNFGRGQGPRDGA